MSLLKKTRVNTSVSYVNNILDLSVRKLIKFFLVRCITSFLF